MPKCTVQLSTYNVLSGTNLLGQLTALHGAQVQVFVEEFSVQDIPHSILQSSSVALQHSGQGTTTYIQVSYPGVNSAIQKTIIVFASLL